MKLKLFYVTNRGHQGPKQFTPTGYGIHPSASGIENLRLGKVTLDTGRNTLSKWLKGTTEVGQGDGVALADYLTKRAEKQAKIVAYREKIPDPDRTEKTQGNTKLGSAEMFAELQKTMRQGRDVLIYIHGFNVSWWEAVGSAFALQAMINRSPSGTPHKKEVLVILFTWPSDGSALPFVAYRSDRTEAIGSGFALGRGFLKLRDFLVEATRPPTDREIAEGKEWEPCQQKINVICHSMGNYVLQNALQRLTEQSNTRRLPRILDHVFLCAPDVDNDVLETGQPLGRLHEICRNISVYFNSGDLALRGSDITKGNPERLGTHGVANLHQIHPQVFQINCSNVVKGFMEHSYYLKGRVNADIRMSLDNVAQEGEERPREKSEKFPNSFVLK